MAAEQHQRTGGTPGGKASLPFRVLGWFADRPLLFLALLLAIQTVPGLWSKDAWLPDEVRHAAVFLQMVENGHWLVLQLGENFYADKPPVYFWFLGALSAVMRTTEPVLFMVAAALTAFGYLAAHFEAARRLGFSKQVALIAGLLLLSNFYFIDRAHQPRMDLMFASFIVLSHMGLFLAVREVGRTDRFWALFGFVMATVAVLVKGPLGIAFPLLAALVYLARQRRLQDALTPAMALGFALLAAVIGLYLAGVAWVRGWAFIRALVVDQTLERSIDVGFQSKPVWFYLPQIALGFLPWTFALIFVPWRDLTQATWWRGLLRAAPDEDPGRSYLWIVVLSGLTLLSLLDYKNSFFLVPIYGVLATLTADALDRAAARPRRAVFLCVAGLLLVAAAVAPFAGELTAWPEHVHGEIAVAVALALAGMLIFFASNRPALIAASASAIGMTLVALPLYVITIPGLNSVMAPRDEGAVLADLSDRGYVLAQYHRFNLGDLDYHTRRPIAHFSDYEALSTYVRQTPCVAVSILEPYLKGWRDVPLDYEVMHRSMMDVNENLVLVWSTEDCPVD